MSTALHLIIPYAATSAPGCRQAWSALAVPSLRRLLARLQARPAGEGQPGQLSLPHEREIAQALGLPAEDGRTPWAAWSLRLSGADPGPGAWAWLSPCHLEVGRDQVILQPVGALALEEAQSRALLEAMRPYFEEDGLTLTYNAPDRWLAGGEMFRGLACAALDRVSGGRVDDWLPRGPEARGLRRLQQEMQMLLYTHPVTDAREAAGQQAVNSFWVSGAGALPDQAPAGPPPGLRVDDRLREPALAQDWALWCERWQMLDTQALPPLLAALEAGQEVTLTLCGQANARTWTTSTTRWWRRAVSALRPLSVAAALEPL